MRSFVKKIASVLAAVFVISSLSMMVSANTLVGSGTVTPQYSGSFDWEYYSNNLLKLYPTDIRININKNDFPSGYLTDETTVYIDLSYVQSLDYDDLRYFVFYGSNCPSGNIIVGGENVSQFDDFSFYDFSYLEEIYFDDDVSLQWLGLFNCGNFSIDIFDQAEINELYVSDCNNLYGIRVPDYIECLQLNDCYCVTGIEISENLDCLQVTNAPDLVAIDIPETLRKCNLYGVGITDINVPNSCDDFSLIGAYYLENAYIEPGREKIDSNMFALCDNLSNITIPDSVTTIEYHAFAGCSSLKSIELPDSVTNIYRGAFRDTALESFIIPNGVTTIEYATFKGCDNLEWIDLPASITRIDESAFDSCENLTDVCFRGSRKQWDEITVYNGWDDKVSDKTLADIFGDADIWFDDLSMIKTQPVDFYGPYGSTAVFSFETYNEISQYQWQIYVNESWRNILVDSATTSQLSFVVTEDEPVAGKPIRCIAVDYSGFTEVTDEVYVVLIDKVNITKQPEDLTCEPGEMATFSVEAEGDGLKYQWQVYKNGAWTNCSIKDGAKTPVLTLEAKESRHESRYKCVITDQYGYSYGSADAILYVRKALTILTQPENCSGAPGDTAIFTVVAEGSGLKYQWQTYKNGSWTNCSINDGAKTDTLSLAIKSSRDGSKYHCVITDKYGATVTTDEVTLTVLNTLSIKQQPATNVIGSEGEMATFKVVAEGEGLKYQWQVYKNDEWTNCSVNDGAKTDTLTLEFKSSRDGLKYHCIVTDKTGASVTSDEATMMLNKFLFVYYPTETEIMAAKDTYVRFNVEAQGDGLKYQWQVLKNGTWTNCSINDGAKTNEMTLEAKMSRNGLKYHCVVSDKYGNTLTSEEFTLHVIDVVIIPPVMSVSSSEVALEDINICADSVEVTETVEAVDAEATTEVVEAANVIEVAEAIETVPEVETETVTEFD